MRPVAEAGATKKSNVRLICDIRRRPSPARQSPSRSGSLRQLLNATGQQVKDEMKKAAMEAPVYIGCSHDGSSGDADDQTLILAPSFEKKTFPSERYMQTITEENETYTVEETRTYSITFHSNSLCSCSNSQQKEMPGFLNPARLESRIVEFDEYLEKDDSIPDSYRARLWGIRNTFDSFRARRVRRDVRDSWRLVDLDLEVQVAYHAQTNIKAFTHLLLHVNATSDIKARVRRYLYYSEAAAKTRQDRNNHQVLAILKTAAADVDKKLLSHPPEPFVVPTIENNAILRRDIREVQSFLKDIFLLRYGPQPNWLSRLETKNLQPLGSYIRWKNTQDEEVAISLSNTLGLHPVELDHVLQARLDSLLWYTDVDTEYVKDRLCDLDNIWHWVYEHNPLADNAEWTKLAGQFYDDRMQFDKIFPGEISYINPKEGIYRSNTKARVKSGMIFLHGHYFAKLKSPKDFKLSGSAQAINRRFIKGEVKRLKAIKEEEERQSGNKQRSKAFSSWLAESRPMVKLKKWTSRARGSLKSRTQSKTYKEMQ
ncbi:MAG: hypothetical protein Q9186_006583 [Xanthomendoza sp. 1 TL-2023]